MRLTHGVTLPLLLALFIGAPRFLSAQGISVRPIDSIPIPGWVTDAGAPIALRGENVVILDEGDQVLLCLDIKTHKESCRFGRKGGGPGEYGAVTYLHSDALGRVAIADVLRRRITVLTPGEKGLKTVSLGASVPARISSLTEDGVILDWVNMFTPEVGKLRLNDGVAEWKLAPVQVDSALVVPNPASPGPMTFIGTLVRPDGMILAGNPLKYRVRLLRRDGPAVTWAERPEVKPVFSTAEEIEARMKQMEPMLANMPASAREAMGDLRAKMRTTPKGYFSGWSMNLDPAGRLWVTTMRDPSKTIADVFGPGGKFLQSITFPDLFTAVSFRGNRIAYVVPFDDNPDDPGFVRVLEVSSR